MIATDEDALICDFAETYNIYEYAQLPVTRAAMLAAGLRSGSRIMMKLSGTDADLRDLLIASAVDRLSVLVWQKTKDGQHNTNRPPSIAEAMMNKDKGGRNMAFDSGEDFEAARERIIEEAEKNG